jgi:hypothetical protein
MRLRDAILLSLSAGFLIIGIHQTMVVGFGKAYWALMLALVLFFLYGLGRNPRSAQTKPTSARKPEGKRKKTGKQ